jgi:RNA polymerase-binding transcription factor DksA
MAADSASPTDWAAALLAARQRLASQVAELSAEFAAIVTAMDDNVPDDEHDAEGATVGYERARVGALLDNARRQLVDLDAVALRGEEAGASRCSACRRPIPIDRLLALPATRLCASCAAGAAASKGLLRSE